MSPDTELDWLLDDFAGRVPHVAQAVAVSSDGLVVAATRTLTKDRADQLAAVASGLVSLLAGAARLLEAGSVVSNLTELDGGFMFSMAVSSGASLMVLASRQCDIGTVSYEMTELINKVGPLLTPASRSDLFTHPGAGQQTW
jgi:uncharacterized protein